MISDFLSQLWPKKASREREPTTKGQQGSSSRSQSMNNNRFDDSFISESISRQSSRYLGDNPAPLDGEVEALLHAKKRANIFVKTATRSKLKDYRPKNVNKTPLQIRTIDESLSQSFVFANLGYVERKMVVQAMEVTVVKQGDILIEQGDEGDNFYIVGSGRFSVLVDNKVVAEITQGRCFGEISLLYNTPRTATVRAIEDGEVFKLDRETFRMSVAHTSAEKTVVVTSALLKVPLLNGLKSAHLKELSDIVEMIPFKAGDCIVRKGSEGSIFYMIKEGIIRVTNIGDDDDDGDDDQEIPDQFLGPGEFFGERALLSGDPRSADVIAEVDTILMALDRESFLTYLGPMKDEIWNQNTTPRTVPRRASQHRKNSASSISTTGSSFTHIDTCVDDLVLIASTGGGSRRGSMSGNYVLPSSSSSSPSRNNSSVPRFKADDHADRSAKAATTASNIAGNTAEKKGGEVQADTPLGSAAAYVATAVAAVSAAVVAVGLPSLQAPESVVAPLSSAPATAQPPSSSAPQTETQTRQNTRDESLLEPIPRPENEIKYTDLVDAGRSLGQGTFANVRLVYHKNAGKYYALKAMRKAELIVHKLQNNVIAEKKIMLACDCPFIVKLFRAFQDTEHLYMLLEYIEGGELFGVIHVRGRDGLSNAQAKFYAAGVTIALAYLHAKDVAYRDLKPENILVGYNGYPKVTDFGFAKVCRNGNKTYTLCGTPEYIAPEIVIGSGHNMAADHWGLGVLIFEMQTGYTPFCGGPHSLGGEDVQGEDNYVICERVVRGQFSFPANFDPMCKALVSRLLNHDPRMRLGSLRGGVTDIKNHCWFQGLDFKSYETLQLVPPPQCTSAAPPPPPPAAPPAQHAMFLRTQPPPPPPGQQQQQQIVKHGHNMSS